MGDQIFNWVVEGKFEVCVSNRSYLSVNSKIRVDAFETPRSYDIQHQHSNSWDTIQLPVPYRTLASSSNILVQQIKKCLNKILDIGANTVAIKLDAIKTWHLKDFVNHFLSCLNEFVDSKKSDWKYVTLTFCSTDEKKIKDVLKSYGDFCDSAKVKTSGGAMSLPPSSPTSTVTAGPLEVVVKEGPLEKADVDVIACTVGSYLDLDSGAASKALNAACSYKLKKKINKETSKRPFENGEIAVLDMDVDDALRCKKVFFGTLFFTKHRYKDSFSSQRYSDKSNVHEFMMRCLDKADSYGYTSIAFPAIGAGGKGYPVDLVAEQMFETATHFHPKSGLKKVFFFVYDKYAFQAFKKAETKLGGGPKLRTSFTNQSKLSCGENSLPPGYTSVREAEVGMLPEEDWELCKCFYMDVFPLNGDQLNFKDGIVIVNGTEHEIASMKETFKVIVSQIQDLRKDFVLMTEDLYTLLQDKISKRCKDDNIRYVFVRGSLYIYGKWNPNVHLVRKDISEMAERARKSLADHSLVTNSDAMKSMIHSSEGVNGARPKNPFSAQQTGFPKEALNVRVFITAEGIRVCVYWCDLLKTSVECIVNAANGTLDHNAGVARVIATMAGFSLVDEGKKLLQKKPYGCIDVGEVCYTGAGQLQYKCVIHAVGPEWSDYKPYSEKTVEVCVQMLHSAIFNSLSQAEELGMKSVAIPSISSGVFGVPKPVCAVAYARAVQDYSKLSQNPIQEVHFVDLDDKMVKLVQEAFHDVVTLHSLPSWYNIKDVLEATKGMSAGTKLGGLSNNVRTQQERPPHQPASTDTGCCFEDNIAGSTTRALTFHISSTQVLHVYSEDLLGSTMPDVDMLVCSDNLKAMEKGFLVSTLRVVAGKIYTDDKDKAFTKPGVKKGDVVVCNGGKTRYKWIAVVVMHTFDKYATTTEKYDKYRVLYRKIFMAAVAKHCRSIALSALGTGTGTAKPEDAIEHFAEGLIDFFQQNKKANLSVHFINKKAEINELARKMMQKRLQMFPQHVNVGTPGNYKPAVMRSQINENSMSQERMSKPQMCKLSKDYTPANYSSENNAGTHVIKPSKASNFSRSLSTPASSVSTCMKESINKNQFSASMSERPRDLDPTMSAALGTRSNGGNLRLFEIDDKSAVNDNDNTPTNPTFNEKGSNNKTVVPRTLSDDEVQSLDKDQSKGPMPSTDDNCVICMDKLKNPKTLPCRHTFCRDCIDQQFLYKEACPTCGAVCGVIEGDQPEGTMDVRSNNKEDCAGFEGCGRIEITYDFPNGIQTSAHPNPGKRYKGIRRTAFLPDNKRGRIICELLRVAFKRKLVFTLGSSRTTGKEDVITWNDIHHKTDHRPNTQFGYPDKTYLDRVTDELKVKGITEDDIPQISAKSRR